jgi:hypothetical protein
MSMGRTPTQQNIMSTTVGFCEEKLSPTSVYRYLFENSGQLFADDKFSSLFAGIGRDSIPPQIVAVVMVLQRLEGLSDREAVERFAFDIRWKYACGGLAFDHPEFVHTVLVRMRARLRKCGQPTLLFDIVKEVAQECGLLGRKRVLDSTPIYDAVATQDTVTLIRSAIRGVLRAADRTTEEALRTQLQRDDDYRSPGKPSCDWNDTQARIQLIDDLCKDANALLETVDRRHLDNKLREAVELLATVVDQDIESGEDGIFRIAKGVAKDRVISTVDPEARHGHKTAARSFDGYKGHVSIDPDSEFIAATTATAGNAGDGSVALALLDELLETNVSDSPARDHEADDKDNDTEIVSELGSSSSAVTEDEQQIGQESADDACMEVYGDAAYGTSEVLEVLHNHEVTTYLKVQTPVAPGGRFSKDAFSIDLQQQTVACPAGHLVPIRRRGDGSGVASFSAHCASCPLKEQCTTAKRGRSISIHASEAILVVERNRQKQPCWQERYRQTRPKVERKIGHAMRRRHGGRRARVRGRERVAQDFSLLATALNVQRLAYQGIRVAPATHSQVAVAA